LIGDRCCCKAAAEHLFTRHRIYVHRSLPTVPRGTERLRLNSNPIARDEDIDALVAALGDVGPA